MAKAARWSDRELAKMTAAGKVKAAGSVGAAAPKNGTAKKTAAERPAKLADIVQSILNAKVSGESVKGRHMILQFDGAQALTVNALFALNPFERMRYRKAWHQAVYWAVMQVSGGPAHLQVLERYYLRVSRTGRGLADPNQLTSYFKAPIDGLKHAGLIIDDGPQYNRRFVASQARARTPSLRLEIYRAEEECDNISQGICQTEVIIEDESQ